MESSISFFTPVWYRDASCTWEEKALTLVDRALYFGGQRAIVFPFRGYDRSSEKVKIIKSRINVFELALKISLFTAFFKIFACLCVAKTILRSRHTFKNDPLVLPHDPPLEKCI